MGSWAVLQGSEYEVVDVFISETEANHDQERVV